MIKEIINNDLENEINDGLVLVDFYATWCGPCQLISPIIEEVAKEHENIKVIKIDVDKFPELSRKYGIMSIPTLMVFSRGKEVKKHIGYLEKEGIEGLLK